MAGYSVAGKTMVFRLIAPDVKMIAVIGGFADKGMIGGGSICTD